MKTSQSHPLRIAELSLPVGGGVIGVTFCPGKKQSEAMTGPWNRDLASDLAVIRDWGAVAVLTLMESDELTAVGCGSLGAEVEGLGLDWFHAPIRDMDIPNDQFEAGWSYVGRRVRSMLAKGQRIVVHCRGGIGRAGMISARLLAEFGVEPEDAIRRVRKVRPGAVETTPQEDHVRACCPVPVGADEADKVVACLLGGAVGDAIGYVVEFDKWRVIQERFGPDGITKPVEPDGPLVVSDDTQMTLFTMEGLLRARQTSGRTDPKDAVREVRLAYLDWLATQGERHSGSSSLTGDLASFAPMRARRAPGMTCLSALNQGGAGSPEQPINDSMGCGGVMRVAPVGWVDPWSPKECFDVGMRVAALTHGHPNGFVSAGAMAAIIRMVCVGMPLEDAAVVALELVTETGAHETRDILHDALMMASGGRCDPDTMRQRLGEGWVGHEALAIGLYAALAADSFEQAVAIGANHDGDSDSTASLAGQLFAAAHTERPAPNAWVRRLDLLEPACRLAHEWVD